MPHANSTTSSPRATSPIASPSTLPCSAVMIAASSSARRSRSSRKRNRIFDAFGERRRAPRRRTRRSRRRPRRPRRRPTRTRPARATRPVAGSNTSPRRADGAVDELPVDPVRHERRDGGAHTVSLAANDPHSLYRGHGDGRHRRHDDRLRDRRRRAAVGRHAGRAVHQGVAGRAGAGRRARRAGPARAHLGPPQHRRLRHLLHRRVGVGDAGRPSRRAAARASTWRPRS